MVEQTNQKETSQRMFKQVIWSVLFYELLLLNSAVKSVSFMSD